MKKNGWSRRVIICLVTIFASVSALTVAYATSNSETKAIEIDNYVYLPLISAVKEYGYNIKESKTKLTDDIIEYLYVVSTNGDDIGSISIGVVNGEIMTVMCDQEFADLNNLMDIFLWSDEGIYVESESLIEVIG